MVDRYVPETPKGTDTVSHVLGNPDSTAEPFASADETVKAMRDPRYQTDSQYRESVLQRLAVSTNSAFARLSDQKPPQPFSDLAKAASGVSSYTAGDKNREVSPAALAEKVAVSPFVTRSERDAAFKDKRYKTDGSYRALVAARLAVTDPNDLL